MEERTKEIRPTKIQQIIENEKGRIGYVIAWLFGVPVSLLFVIFLIRGH
jgi:hypothetical protein